MVCYSLNKVVRVNSAKRCCNFGYYNSIRQGAFGFE